jgi:hypothetical protein
MRSQLADCKDACDDLEYQRANLQINNEELFQRLHQQTQLTVRLRASLDVYMGQSRMQAQGQAQVQSQALTQQQSRSQNELRQSAPMCVCCASEPITTCFQPCGHAAACAKCAREIVRRARGEFMTPRCPVCRQDLGPGEEGDNDNDHNNTLLTAPRTMTRAPTFLRVVGSRQQQPHNNDNDTDDQSSTTREFVGIYIVV